MIRPESTHRLCNPLERLTVNEFVVAKLFAGTVTGLAAGTGVPASIEIVGVNVPGKSPVFDHVITTDMLDGHVAPGHCTLHGVGQDGPAHWPHTMPCGVMLTIVIVVGCCIFTDIHWLTILLFPPIFIIVFYLFY